jgi:hypothetical protein
MDNLIFNEMFGDYIKYTCKLSESYIIFKLTKDYIIYDNGEFDWDNLKMVLNLLKISFEDLKKFNKNKYRYTIKTDEIEYIDIDKWNVIEKNDSFTTVECDLENAFDNVVKGFL